jgi:hypothetical protein
VLTMLEPHVHSLASSAIKTKLIEIMNDALGKEDFFSSLRENNSRSLLEPKVNTCVIAQQGGTWFCLCGARCVFNNFKEEATAKVFLDLIRWKCRPGIPM